MAAPARYVQRVARLPQVFEVLAAHPAGLPLTDLAAAVGAPADEIREDLLAFYTADVAVLMGLSRPTVLEFLAADGSEDDPNLAEVVRIVDERPADELGVEHVDASELALVYASARALLDIEPDNEDLRAAVDVLTGTLLGGAVEEDGAASSERSLDALQDAVAQHRRVRIVYSRTWNEGVGERVVDPYRLVQTRRGWEVDAGPPDEHGRIRTFLLSNIRSYDVQNDTFTPPADLDRLLQEQRATTTVRVRIPHEARWAADFYAEQVTVVDDDELTATLDLALLPPVEQRVGLVTLIAGGDIQVLDPPGLITAGPRLAKALLEHHTRSAG
jgi:proteasome accessory factor C